MLCKYYKHTLIGFEQESYYVRIGKILRHTKHVLYRTPSRARIAKKPHVQPDAHFGCQFLL